MPKLTAELCEKVMRRVADPGPTLGLSYFTDEEYLTSIQTALADAPDESAIWVFGYGSLIWKPAFPYIEERVGAIHGWHRSFCLKTTRWRGTPDKPGLMMALETGGHCRGIAFRLAPETAKQSLDKLWRREIGVKPVNHDPRWVRVSTNCGDIWALTFTANRNGQSYVGELSYERTADVIAEAVGVWGSCAEYLYETNSRLKDVGIRDRRLCRLERLVAARITSAAAVSRCISHSLEGVL